MSKFIISYKHRKSESSGGSGSSESDLVKLGILSKPISEFGASDIGTTVYIPYNDASNKILLNNGRIEFEVVGVNHHTSAEHPITITLMSKNVLRSAIFDGGEPENLDSDRKRDGNNRWSVSNIRQWLNSSGAANSWWTAQHEYDAAPIPSNVYGEANAAYADAPGFLAGFSADVLQHFTDITNTTAICEPYGGGSETTIDKVFLASNTEMGFGNNNNIAEGTDLPKFTDNNNSRKKNNSYWTRSPFPSASAPVWYIVGSLGDKSPNSASAAGIGIAPIIVLH